MYMARVKKFSPQKFTTVFCVFGADISDKRNKIVFETCKNWFISAARVRHFLFLVVFLMRIASNQLRRRYTECGS
jgi:hypothetical protein